MNSQTAPKNESLTPIGWNRSTKTVISLFLIYHLAAMVLSPLSLPPSSGLVRWLQQGVAHYQSLLYLNHGYRFFAPNPGPSRLVRYEITFKDGKKESGIFPDRDAINKKFPRLLYHRWFMLSESIANLTTIDARKSEIKDHLNRLQSELKQIESNSNFQDQNTRPSEQILQEIQDVQNAWEVEQKRRQDLLRPVAESFLSATKESLSVRLWIQVRDLPNIDQVRRGIQPSDPRFMSSRGRFDMGTWFADGTFKPAEIPAGQGGLEEELPVRLKPSVRQGDPNLEELPPAGG